MKILKSYTIFPVLLGLMCGVNTNTTMAATFQGIRLGQGFSHLGNKPTLYTCVEGNNFIEGNSATNLSVEADESYEKVMEELSGMLSFGISFPLLSILPMSKFVRNITSTQFRETWSITMKKKVRATLVPGTLSIPALVQNMERQEIANRCGEAFINQIDFEAVFKGTLLIEYSSREEKRRLGGGLNVSLTGGVAELEGSHEKALALRKSKSKILIKSRQIGGKIERLGQVLNMKFAACDAEEAEACFETFAGLTNYLKEFEESTRSFDSLEPLAFHMASYKESNLPSLACDIPSIPDDVLQARSKLASAINSLSSKWSRLDWATRISTSEAANISRMESMRLIEESEAKLTKALLTCYGETATSVADLKTTCEDEARASLSKIPVIPSTSLNF